MIPIMTDTDEHRLELYIETGEGDQQEWRMDMANRISDETIEYVGILSILDLSDSDIEAA